MNSDSRGVPSDESLEIFSTKFAHKVVAVKETKDLKVTKLKESMGSLRTFKIELEQDNKDKRKS